MSLEGEVLVKLGRMVAGEAPVPELGCSLSQICPDLDGSTRSQKGAVLCAQNVGLEDLLWGGGTSQVHRKMRGMTPTPKLHNSVTDTPLLCPDL